MPESLTNTQQGGKRLLEQPVARSWPFNLLGLLLLVQALGYFFLGGLHTLFIEFDLELTPQDFLINIPLGLRGGAFIGLGILALMASAGFFRRWTSAWLNAVMVQGFSLALAIYLYFRERPPYIYALMLYGIIMIIYLNYSEVTAAFRPERSVKDLGGIDEHG